MSVSWEALVRELAERQGGLVDRQPGEPRAVQALTSIIGRDSIVEAVNHYVENGPASELIREVLQLIRPRLAMHECFEIWKTSSRANERVGAVELLRTIGDAYALQWLDVLLQDTDPMVQVWASRLVDELAMHGLVDREVAESWARRFEQFENEAVRETARMIRRCYEAE
ncbi:MAG: hypothetical protein WBM75_08010 [Polyangiales bacterium]